MCNVVDLPSIVVEGGCWTPEYGGGACGATAEGGTAEDEEAILSGVAERSSAAAAAATAGTETAVTFIKTTIHYNSFLL